MKISRIKDIDLSICIVSWNVQDRLKNCLRSIFEVRRNLDYEVIVVDNGSGDGSGEMVKEEFLLVSLIQNQGNRGFAAACNQAIQKSSAPYLLLLNPDTEVRPGALEEMMRFLDNHPAAGGSSCRLLNPDGSLQRGIRSFPTCKTALREFTILGDLGFFRREKRRYFCSDFDYDREAIVEQPMGAALFLRKSAVEKVGLMDEAFFLYFEEVDLCRRLVLADYLIWYNPSCTIIHIGGESTMQAGSESFYHLIRSQLHYLKKYHGPGAFWYFEIPFKFLFVLGFFWGMAENMISFAVKYLTCSSQRRLENTSRRLRMKCEFCRRFLLRLIFI